jgi:hypothetical protein
VKTIDDTSDVRATPEPSEVRAIVVLVPAFNEAPRIGHTVRALNRMASVTEIVVVDDASPDETSSEARRAGACCITLPRNVGKGDALNVGIGLIRQRIVDGLLGVPDVILLADADLGATASHLEILTRALGETDADIAIATLPPQQGSAGFGVATGLASAGLRRLTGRVMEQPLSGQRAVRWTALPSILPFAPDFGVEVAMTLAASETGLDIVEVEVPLSHRATRRDLSGIRHRARQALDIATVLSRHMGRHPKQKQHTPSTSPRHPARRVREWVLRSSPKI